MVTVPDGHRLAGRVWVRMAELADEAFVGIKSASGLREMTDELAAAAGFTPTLAFEGEEVDTLRGLVAAGLGAAVLPLAEPAPPQGCRGDSVASQGNPPHRPDLGRRPPDGAGRAGLPGFRPLAGITRASAFVPRFAIWLPRTHLELSLPSLRCSGHIDSSVNKSLHFSVLDASITFTYSRQTW